MSDISDKLVEVIKDDNFQDTIVDLGETAIDTILEDGILRDIPFLGTIFGLTKATMSIQDKLFVKKILTFLLQLKDTDLEQRRKQIEKIDRDSKYKIKVGEKLLYIIDKCEDNEKAVYLGKLFQCYIEEKLSYEDFLRASKCIELTFLYDLKRFIKDKWYQIDDAEDLAGAGIMSIRYKSGEYFEGSYSNGTIEFVVSPIGELIQNLLSEVDR